MACTTARAYSLPIAPAAGATLTRWHIPLPTLSPSTGQAFDSASSTFHAGTTTYDTASGSRDGDQRQEKRPAASATERLHRAAGHALRAAAADSRCRLHHDRH